MERPRNLDELLRLLPGLRRFRSLNADQLRKLLDRQDRECTWCGVVVEAGRLRWCSDACVTAFKLRCDPNSARRHVVARDRGICQICRRDTNAAEQEFNQRRLANSPWRQTGEAEHDYRRRVDDWEAARRALGYARGRMREVDHRVPVVEYGGLCDPAELQLLCGACHADATKRLTRRRGGGRSKPNQ